jgi:hypothetical protein
MTGAPQADPRGKNSAGRHAREAMTARMGEGSLTLELTDSQSVNPVISQVPRKFQFKNQFSPSRLDLLILSHSNRPAREGEPKLPLAQHFRQKFLGIKPQSSTFLTPQEKYCRKKSA